MNWEAILKAYPNDTESILGIKALREKVEETMSSLSVPALETPCREMDDFDPFIQFLTPVCIEVWTAATGTAPSFDMASMLKAFIAGSELTDISEGELDLAEGIMNATISRFLHLLREKNPHLIPEEWSSGTCPFCGAFPKIGFDYEDKRVLACLSCGHTWRFARVTCYACGATDHNVLGYFDTEGNEGVRVYFCRSCRNYIKIVDARVKIVDDPETEDALTIGLDDIAVKEEFIQPALNE
jgi:formate dehydrogenase maturation protein FdhE